VNSGTGSGSYEAGTVVNISANTAPFGQTFDKWTGSTSGIADVNSATTTYTMGSAAATITATYKALPPTTYTLTVNSGIGGGSYTAGTVVNISANTAPSGQTFDKWTGNTSGVADVNSATTTYTMVSASATITATYKALPPTTYTITASAGSNGFISPSGTVTVNAGDNKTFTFTSNSGYEVEQVTVNGSAVGFSGNSYTFSNVQANASIHVTFKATSVPPPSSDATLSGLALNVPGLTPAFSPDVTAYQVEVANSVTMITITATSNNGDATVSGMGTYPLNVGTNVFTITVTAADGSVKTYTITVIRSDIADGIADVEAARVWASPGQLHLVSPQAGEAMVYTISGYLVRKISFSAGKTITALPEGIYVVTFNGASYKVTVK
jgi:hypothetical protein